MKTAMQELIDWLKEKRDKPIEEGRGLLMIQHVIAKCYIAREKEKEQIIQAHNDAVISPYTELYVHKIQGKSPITKGEDYFNNKFNIKE